MTLMHSWKRSWLSLGRDIESAILVARKPASETDVESPSADVVNGSGVFGQTYGVVQRRYQDAGGQSNGCVR